MNCLEFERILPEVLEGGDTTERQAHLNSCPACSNLLADLNHISVQAKTLADSAEQRRRIVPGDGGIRFIALGGVPGAHAPSPWTELGGPLPVPAA